MTSPRWTSPVSNMVTATRSPTSSVFSIDPEGIANHWRTKVLNMAARTTTAMNTRMLDPRIRRR